MVAPYTVHTVAAMRTLAFAWLTTATLAGVSAAGLQSSRGGTGEVVAIRELQLKHGADVPEFERFVRETYNRTWEGAVPGVKGYIAKADRGAQKGSYALVLIFDSKNTRDAIYPKEGGGASDAFKALVAAPISLSKQLDAYIEPGGLSVYTDYVELR